MSETKQRDELITAQIFMAQAQVFASAWAMVGGIFDSGGALGTAEAEKEALAGMARSVCARIAELEAEIARRDEQEAAIGAGGVEPLRKRELPAFYVRNTDVLALADKRVAGRGAMLSKEGGAGMTAFYASAAVTGETA